MKASCHTRPSRCRTATWSLVLATTASLRVCAKPSASRTCHSIPSSRATEVSIAAVPLPLVHTHSLVHQNVRHSPSLCVCADRVVNRKELLALLSSKMSGITKQHLYDACSKARIPCCPINSIPEVFSDPQVRYSTRWECIALHDSRSCTRNILDLPSNMPLAISLSRASSGARA